MTSYQYRKSHCGDTTILRPSYLHNEIIYTGKTSLYWIGALSIKIKKTLFNPFSAITVCTVRCRYNVVQYVMILHTILQPQQQNIFEHLWTHKRQPPSLALTGEIWASIVRMLEKNDRYNGIALYIYMTRPWSSLCLQMSSCYRQGFIWHQRLHTTPCWLDFIQNDLDISQNIKITWHFQWLSQTA